jgi:hypothetical protein
VPNPFFFGGHVTDPDKFVGRKAELCHIAPLLETTHIYSFLADLVRRWVLQNADGA